MPFPTNLESLTVAGYKFLRSETCPECQLAIEVFQSPAKREVVFQPLCQVLSPVIPHSHVCRPNALPKTRKELYATWEFQKIVECYECKRAVSLCKRPDGELVYMEPMMDDNWPVEVHKHQLVQSRTTPTFESGGTATPPEPQTPVLGAPEGQQRAFRMYGVTDKNMMAVGWMDGTLKVRFKFGEYLYRNVPEDVFVTLRKVPYPNNYFTKVVKNHPEQYPFTKVA